MSRPPSPSPSPSPPTSTDAQAQEVEANASQDETGNSAASNGNADPHPGHAQSHAATHEPAALAPAGHAHEAQAYAQAQTILTVSASPSPVPPTPPPKDPVFVQHLQHHQNRNPPEPELEPELEPEMGHRDDAAESIVIDIRGDDPDRTLRADDDFDSDSGSGSDSDGHGKGGGKGKGKRTGKGNEQGGRRKAADEGMPRDSDVTDMTDADITIVHPGRRSDSPDPTLYGSGSGSGGGASAGAAAAGAGAGAGEGVQEHPLRMALHPPSPPPWDSDRDLENGRRVLGEDGDDTDLDLDGDLGLGGGGGRRNGRASPQRFELSGARAQRVHEFGNGNGNGTGNKPRSHSARVPHSAYYFGPPPPDAAYGTEPCGQIGVHHPREVVRIERDYTGGELPQFTPVYPLELEGRITPTQFLEMINAINEILLSAHSLSHAFVDNALAFFSLQVSRAVKKTHYEKEMERLKELIDELNVQIYNPTGLHIRWPRSVAFLFLEIEYY